MHARYAWDDAQRSGWFVGRVLRRGVPAKDITKTLTLTLTLTQPEPEPKPEPLTRTRTPSPNLNVNPDHDRAGPEEDALGQLRRQVLEEGDR